MEKSITTTLNEQEFESKIFEAVIKGLEKFGYPRTPEKITDDYLDQREAAKFLRVSLPTIIRWKKEKKIPYYQEERTVLFRKSELLNVLQKNESLLK